MNLAKQLGEHVRVRAIYGDEVLRVVSINSRYRRVMVEIPNADGSGRIVEYFRAWYDADQVEPA